MLFFFILPLFSNVIFLEIIEKLPNFAPDT